MRHRDPFGSHSTRQMFASAASHFSSLTDGAPTVPLQLPRHVRLLNAVLCARCRYPVVPLLCILALVALSLYMTVTEFGCENVDVVDWWTGISNAAELTANTVFGYYYWRNERVDKMISDLENLGVAPQDSTRRLGLFVWAALFVSTATCTVPSILWYGLHTPSEISSLTPSPTPSPVWYAEGCAMPGMINSFLFAQMLHLTACWLWSCHMYRHAAACVVETYFTAQDVAGRKAGQTAFFLLSHMHATSKVWAVNHLVRFFTTVALASAYMHRAQVKVKMFDTVWCYVLAAMLSGSAWATAAYPGFVNKATMGMRCSASSQRSPMTTSPPTCAPWRKRTRPGSSCTAWAMRFRTRGCTSQASQ